MKTRRYKNKKREVPKKREKSHEAELYAKPIPNANVYSHPNTAKRRQKDYRDRKNGRASSSASRLPKSRPMRFRLTVSRSGSERTAEREPTRNPEEREPTRTQKAKPPQEKGEKGPRKTRKRKKRPNASKLTKRMDGDTATRRAASRMCSGLGGELLEHPTLQ